MREIKFRYWDKENNEMINADVLAFEEYLPIADHLNQEGIMQYTGVKDVKGVEIYEGDIVGCSYRSPLNGKMIVDRWTIEYRKGMYWLKDSKNRQQYDRALFLKRDSEVIGNIYENPELIK